MKTIQHLTRHQFTERTIVLGAKVISTGAVVAAFALLVALCINDHQIILMTL